MHSNHLHALAYAGQTLDIPTIGIVRCYNHQPESQTVKDIQRMGMAIIKWHPERYQSKHTNETRNRLHQAFPDALIIPEGGAEYSAMAGFSHLFNQIAPTLHTPIDYFVTPVGTGTTLAGCIYASKALTAFQNTQFIGIAAVKDRPSIMKRCHDWLPSSLVKRITLYDDYTFGGFAKVKPALAKFMIEFEEQNALLLDPVYTAKMFYAIQNLVTQGVIKQTSRILCLHTGGLQGRPPLIKKILRLANTKDN